MAGGIGLRAVLFVILGWAGVGSVHADDWGEYQHDAQHTGRSTSQVIPGSLAASWASAAGFHSPVIAGGQIYAIAGGGTLSTQVEAFDEATGHVNWTVSAHYSNENSLASVNGMLVYSGETTTFSPVISDTTALYVLDEATGAQKYTVPLPEAAGQVTVAPSAAGQPPVAYLSDGRGKMTAVQLGDTSGTVLWTATGISGGMTPPAVLDDILVTGSVDHYYAINRTTGAVTQFRTGSFSGPGNYHPVADAARHEFYISGYTGLDAYSDVGGVITLLWERTGAGIAEGTSVAIGPDGSVYSADATSLVKLDPADGHTLDLVSAATPGGNLPLISDGFVWDLGVDTLSGIPLNVYSLSDLSLATHVLLPADTSIYGSGGFGALDDTHLIFDVYRSTSGFIVYRGTALPEPGGMAISGLAVGMVLLGRRRRIAI